MDASQSSLSPVQNPFVVFEPERRKSSNLFGELGSNMEEAMGENSEGFIGVLEVCIHQARGIQNICIYHKQDVYSKFCLTSNPEDTVTTEVIDGGGQNPIFNQNLRLNVQNIGSSLKCEVWMLSKLKNFLEDQLLGFALVPLSEVLARNGKLSQEFALSSTELFHSPAGFVQLSLLYYGDSPEGVVLPGPNQSLTTNVHMEDSEILDSDLSMYNKIEFPDPRVVNETNLMVSEYADMQCATMNSHCSESLGTSVSADSPDVPKNDTPTSSVSTNGSLSASLPANSKVAQVAESESDSSAEVPSNAYGQSILSVKTEPQQSVFQQEIVDMYMKSMQQFTESLAKMKLPMDIDNGTTNSENASNQNPQAANATGSRVFYGSRAFF